MQQTSILYVEDDEALALLFRHVFSKASLCHSVHVVNDGQQAIDYLDGIGVFADRERYPLPRIVLMDLSMPRVSGLQLLKWIRQQSQFSSLPLIMLTSSTERADIQAAYALGANGYIVKPTALPQLLKVFENVLQICMKNGFSAGGWLNFPGNQPKPESAVSS